MGDGKMRVRDLADALGDNMVSVSGDMDYAPSGVANDHRLVAPGGVFVCVKGFSADGHAFIPGAAANGAAVVIAQRPIEAAPPLKAIIQVRDARRALAAAAHLFYGAPTKKLKLAGVTGTKGKTTVTYMIRSILRSAGLLPGMLGTIENDIGGRILPAAETTPESSALAALFSRMVERGCECAVMEVSSQGLALSRVDCCEFDVGVFTNFYRDHISPNEHGGMEEYFAAKLKLFSMCRNAVINADIAEFSAVRDAFMSGGGGGGGACVAYSADGASPNRGAADVRASRIELLYDGGRAYTRFYAETPWFCDTVTVGLPGRYNVSNALAALSVCLMFGVAKEAVLQGLRGVSVRGRTQPVEEGQKFTVLVDYAHNAGSLEALLAMLREYDFKNITTVFGCGGNRARDRRFSMGEVSGRRSDFTIVTSDNPRKEDPAMIMDDIVTGLKRTNGRYILIEDRREAIKYAIENAREGDLVLLAGKGHETEQTFADRTIHFDDAQVAGEILRGLHCTKDNMADVAKRRDRTGE